MGNSLQGEKIRKSVNMIVSVILPTYNEAENIKLIVPKISNVLRENNIVGEILVIDDDSPDGTEKIARRMANEYPVRVHARKNERGLATAVIRGFELARGDICLVMDADMSHPVEKIPEMIKPIIEGHCDATVGSRYMTGGNCGNWSLKRIIISKGAGLLARGVVRLSDPTSGFMAIKKGVLEGVKLDPIGWKIVLEVIVKTNARFKEIPIIFADRQFGESKLNPSVQKEYLLHLWKLYCFRYPNIIQFAKFCIVGLSGLFVDTAVLVSIVELFSFDPRFAAIFAFLAAVSWNYLLNRLWTFHLGGRTKVLYSFISFVIICAVGFGVRIGVMHLLIKYAEMGKRPWYILASVLGILVGTIFNFIGSKYVSFSKSFVMRTGSKDTSESREEAIDPSEGAGESKGDKR